LGVLYAGLLDPSFFPARGQLVSFKIFFFPQKKKKLENMIEKAQSEQGREYPQGSQGQAGMSHVEQGARF